MELFQILKYYFGPELWPQSRPKILSLVWLKELVPVRIGLPRFSLFLVWNAFRMFGTFGSDIWQICEADCRHCLKSRRRIIKGLSSTNRRTRVKTKNIHFFILYINSMTPEEWLHSKAHDILAYCGFKGIYQLWFYLQRVIHSRDHKTSWWCSRWQTIPGV